MARNRHSIRLPGYDYSLDGWYFVTICTYKRECLFGEIENGVFIPNKIGEIVDHVWSSTTERFGIRLDQIQIMPNHVHFVIEIVGAHHDAPKSVRERAIRESPLRRSTLSQIIGYLKMNSAKQIHGIDPDIQIWQRNYYERIIRNEKELNKIREYIQMNPVMWEKDKENPKNLKYKKD